MLRTKYYVKKFASELNDVFSPVKKGHRVLMYHSIGDFVEMDSKRYFSVSLDRFQEQVNFMANQNQYNLVDFGDENVKKDFDSVSLTVTFDDGYKNNLLNAAPLLEELDIPFYVFISTSFVQESHNDFLSASEVKELSSFSNAILGAHGHIHQSLSDMSDEGVYREVDYSKKYLEDLIGREVFSMSYPNGAVNKRVRDIVEKSGYKLGFTSYMDVNLTNSDPLLLSRVEVVNFDTIRSVRQKIEGKWDWCHMLQEDPNL